MYLVGWRYMKRKGPAHSYLRFSNVLASCNHLVKICRSKKQAPQESDVNEAARLCKKLNIKETKWKQLDDLGTTRH